MSLLDIKPNVPKVRIGSYTFVLAGIPKIGKTTLFYDLVMKHLKDPMKGLLLATENGFKGLAGIIAKSLNDWSDFTTAVDELIQKRDQMPFELIGIDTIDALVEMCGKQVLREWNRDNQEDRKRTYKDIPYNRGHEKVRDKIMDQLDLLIKADYGLFIITHSQEKKVKQKGGEGYDQLQPSLPGKTGTAIENMADFLIFATNYQDVSGDSSRWLYYRNNGYVKAGGRFKNVPEKVEFTLQNFLTVFEDAVKGSFEGNVDLEKLSKAESTEATNAAKDFVASEQAKKTPEALVASIHELVSAMPTDRQNEVAAVFKKITGTKDYRSITNVDHLTKMLEACEA